MSQAIEQEKYLVTLGFKYRTVTLILFADAVTNSYLVDNVHFFWQFLMLRQVLCCLIIYSNYQHRNTMSNIYLLALYILVLFIIIYVSSLIFSKDGKKLLTDISVFTSCIFSFVELHLLTDVIVKNEKKKTKAIWRANKKAKGDIEALRKDDENEKAKKELKYSNVILTIGPYFSARYHWIIYCTVGVVINTSLMSFTPYINAKILDGANMKDLHMIKYFLLLRFVFIILQSITHYVQAYYQRMIREWVEFDIRQDIFQVLMQCEIGYYDSISTGEISSVAYHSIYDLSIELGWHLRCFLEFITKTFWVTYIMFSIDSRLAICSVLITPVICCGFNYFNAFSNMISTIIRDSMNDISKMVNESIRNVRTVKYFGCEQFEINRYLRSIKEVWEIYDKEIWYTETRLSFCNFLPQLSSIMVMYFGISLVFSDELTFGQLTAFLSYQSHINWVLQSVSEKMSILKKISIKSHKFIKILKRTCELPRKGSQKPKCCGHIEFKNVNFAYPTKKDKIILHDVSMEVKPGEVVALVGESGGGKSTIVKLISYLYGPGEGQGEILLDGIPVSQWDANHFSRNVISVPQEPVLFSRSIRENISYGISMKEEEIKAAAKMANAHEFIVKLDNGYDSVVGERGVTLSGGQRQRICIARALARKPTVLILDEATSSLDTKSEHLVHKAIDDIIRYSNDERRVSIVVIAHRLSTIMNADSICVINDGRIVEQGTHKKLIADKGPYFELVQQQRLSTDIPPEAA